MKRFIHMMILSLLLISMLSAQNIGAWDAIALNSFGELIAVSTHRSELGRFQADSLLSSFSDDAVGAKLSLEELLKPVLDDPDRIHVLDRGTRSVISWDRFLNLHAITLLHDDIVTPTAFTVTSEHDWLIYDEFTGQIFQIHSGENYPLEWGTEVYAQDLELFALRSSVMIFERESGVLTQTDENGNTLFKHTLPDSLDVLKIFPQGPDEILLSGNKGLFLWKPQSAKLRYLSDVNNLIFAGRLPEGTIQMVSRDGALHYLP